MDNNKEEIVNLPSGLNISISTDTYDNHFEFTPYQLSSFDDKINAGNYFPQIMQFIAVVSVILNGKTSFREILLCNIIFGIGNMLLWFWGRFYKTPLFSFVSCLIGRVFFKFSLHYVVIAVIAFFVVKDWKVLLFCVISGIITYILKLLLFSHFLNKTKYNDEVVRYVSGYKYKQ